MVSAQLVGNGHIRSGSRLKVARVETKELVVYGEVPRSALDPELGPRVSIHCFKTDRQKVKMSCFVLKIM